MTEIASDLVRQILAHAQAAFVDRTTVHHRIGAGQIDILENAGRKAGHRRALRLNSSPRESTSTASPGATSRTT
jgi:hypothetical protein